MPLSADTQILWRAADDHQRAGQARNGLPGMERGVRPRSAVGRMDGSVASGASDREGVGGMGQSASRASERVRSTRPDKTIARNRPTGRSPDDFRPDEHKQYQRVYMKLGSYTTCTDCAALVRRYRRGQSPALYCRLGYPIRDAAPAGMCPHPETSWEVELVRKLYRRLPCRDM